MNLKQLLKKWLWTIIFSYIIMFSIFFFAGNWGHSSNETYIFSVIVWTISYTFFYFIKHWKVLFRRE